MIQERGTYLRAVIRGVRGFSSGGETHWTLGKAKAPESSRRQLSSVPSLTRNRRNRGRVPRHLPPLQLFSTPEISVSLPLRPLPSPRCRNRNSSATRKCHAFLQEGKCSSSDFYSSAFIYRLGDASG